MPHVIGVGPRPAAPDHSPGGRIRAPCRGLADSLRRRTGDEDTSRGEFEEGVSEQRSRIVCDLDSTSAQNAGKGIARFGRRSRQELTSTSIAT